MSYSVGIGAYAYGSGPCIALYANYDGTQIPGWVCPAPIQKTGHTPPRPRFCEGGPHQFQQALKLGGHYGGAVDGIVGPGTLAAIKSVVTKYGIAWDGDPWSVGQEICSAVIRDSIAASPCPDPSQLKVGCAVRGYGPLDSYKTTPSTATTSPEGPTYAVINPEIAKSLLSRQTPSLTTSTSNLSSAILAASRTTMAPTSSPQATMQDVAVVPQTPPELPPDQVPTKSIPTWAYVAGGVAVIGGIGAIAMLRKK